MAKEKKKLDELEDVEIETPKQPTANELLKQAKEALAKKSATELENTKNYLNVKLAESASSGEVFAEIEVTYSGLSKEQILDLMDDFKVRGFTVSYVLRPTYRINFKIVGEFIEVKAP